MGIMDKKLETTILGYVGFVLGFRYPENPREVPFAAEAQRPFPKRSLTAPQRASKHARAKMRGHEFPVLNPEPLNP